MEEAPTIVEDASRMVNVAIFIIIFDCARPFCNYNTLRFRAGLLISNNNNPDAAASADDSSELIGNKNNYYPLSIVC